MSRTARTYFVSRSHGCDDDSRQSPSRPKKTRANGSATVFQPGIRAHCNLMYLTHRAFAVDPKSAVNQTVTAGQEQQEVSACS